MIRRMRSGPRASTATALQEEPTYRLYFVIGGQQRLNSNARRLGAEPLLRGLDGIRRQAGPADELPLRLRPAVIALVLRSGYRRTAMRRLSRVLCNSP